MGNIDIGHFKTFSIKSPESISVQSEINTSGDMILTPFIGQEASPEKMQKVLAQITKHKKDALRVNKELIILDDKKRKAVEEIISKRVIPKEKVKDFFKNPTAYIDASIVDLDLGIFDKGSWGYCL